MTQNFESLLFHSSNQLKLVNIFIEKISFSTYLSILVLTTFFFVVVFDEVNETVQKMLLIHVYTCAAHNCIRGHAIYIFQELDFACSHALSFLKVLSKFLRLCMGKGRKRVRKK